MTRQPDKLAGRDDPAPDDSGAAADPADRGDRTGRRAWLRGASALAMSAQLTPAIGRAADRPGLRKDPRGVLDLPEGFTYRVIERVGANMDDGFRVPGRPDAMACFPLPDGKLALMRNHELSTLDPRTAWPAGGKAPPEAYRDDAVGGVSRIVLDAATGERVSSNLVLTGTALNCAGGTSPWGFLSCEETVAPGHGYVFLCDPTADRVRPPRRIEAYGRFRHEAALVDPDSLIAYLTEDELDSAFYRFLPTDRAKPFSGRLQALTLVDARDQDTAMARDGDSWAVAWLDLDPSGAAAAGQPLKAHAHARGAARIVRGEGLWRSGHDLYFTATAGGPAGRGQIFHLDTRENRLRVVVASSDPGMLDMPDNLTVGPGGHLYVAEDGPAGNRLFMCTVDGELVPLAHNALSLSEFAGVCFSPDQRFMFVNMQEDGLTLGIEGPFAEHLARGRTDPSRDPLAGVFGLTGGAAVLAVAALVHRRRSKGG